ncbi:hypothetical protein M513_09579 [Trichuris suis]|uniref:Uncharacterized protein n=1 Tax=Trichuris suis TaxID=68888 RepID=A0A085LX58_9BILA|nr:hypothetical protein M513_09579 [Trichuris suis]
MLELRTWRSSTLCNIGILQERLTVDTCTEGREDCMPSDRLVNIGLVDWSNDLCMVANLVDKRLLPNSTSTARLRVPLSSSDCTRSLEDKRSWSLSSSEIASLWDHGRDRHSGTFSTLKRQSPKSSICFDQWL